MKLFIFLLVLASIAFTPEAHALFGHVAAERNRREHAEQQLTQAQQTTGQLIHTNQQLHTAISVLSASVAVALIIGAAVGSKTRRNATRS